MCAWSGSRRRRTTTDEDGTATLVGGMSSRGEPEMAVELLDGAFVGDHHDAWSDLVSRTLEPNVFLEPTFLLPLLRHLPPRSTPRFLLAWRAPTASQPKQMLGLLPLRLPVRASLGLPLARGIDHALTAVGVPLLDAEQGVATFDAMVSWLGALRPRLAGLVLSNVPTAGVFWTSMLARSRSSILDVPDRAGLARGSVAAGLSSKRRKDLARQRRRRSEIGRLEFRSSTEPVDVEREADRFLALECSGWKGRRGTALAVQPSLADFTRTMTRAMAFEGKCRVDSLLIDGRPIAMGIVLRTSAHAYFWKTSFDEAFADLSPGVHLALELTDLQKRDDSLVCTDSCAIADHPMINRIWPERMQVADVKSDTKRHRDVIELKVVKRLELAWRRLRRSLKAAVRSARRFRRRFSQSKRLATPTQRFTKGTC